MARLREAISQGEKQTVLSNLDQLEAAHQKAIQDWAATGATGPPPVRDEAKFTAARTNLQKAETSVLDAKTAWQTFQAKFEALAKDLETVGGQTTDLIHQIQLQEAETLFQALDDAETHSANLRAQILGLAIALNTATAYRENFALIGKVNNLRTRLETFPPEPTDAQCRASRQSWEKFGQTLRTDPNATYKEGATQ
jgi:hypothetical protein